MENNPVTRLLQPLRSPFESWLIRIVIMSVRHNEVVEVCLNSATLNVIKDVQAPVTVLVRAKPARFKDFVVESEIR